MTSLNFLPFVFDQTLFVIVRQTGCRYVTCLFADKHNPQNLSMNQISNVWTDPELSIMIIYNSQYFNPID